MAIEKLFLPFQEYECQGKMIYNSDEIDDVTFTVKQMQNGEIIGTMKISSTAFSTVYNLFRSGKSFQLSGIDGSGSRIDVNHCFLTSIRTSTDSILSAEFNAFETILNPERLKDNPKNKLVILFALLNVDETFKVNVDTRLGKLYFHPIKGYKDILPVIKTLGVSGITTVAKLLIETPDTSLTFKKILSDAIDVIEGILWITRLADGCYHNWCSVSIFEKMKDQEKYERVLYEMKRPKIKPPRYRRLTNPAHSHIFIRSAYAGYLRREKELNELYDFNIALEWYLEANIASVLESKYLVLCTCLELLVDRYQTKSGTEFILDQTTFKNLYSILVATARECMEKSEIESDRRKEIYMKLKGLNRRSFRSGIESLLNHLKVKYDDLFDDIGVIVRIRNKITHSGTYDNADELFDAFNRLYMLLARIFLSILNYEHDYFDWVKREWVNLRDSRTN